MKPVQLYATALLFVLLLACLFTTHAQQANNFPASLSSSLAKWEKENPQEKMALQTDKGYYLAGETIWMKVWCMLDGIPSFLSKILYVDLVNEQGDVVIKNMYQLDSMGSSAASIDLPFTVKQGNYTIRAYTLWMLNYDFIAEKNVFIDNSETTTAKPVAQQPLLLLQFFPEGGDMINGLQGKVAFQVLDQQGMPVAAKGFITNSRGDKITDFETRHLDMGYFTIKPSAGETYYGNINNYSRQFKLPEVKKEGISLLVDNKDSKIFISLERSATNAAAYNNLYLCAAINGKIAFFNEFDVDEGKSAAAISKKDLPPGIIQLTVFSKAGVPLAERIAFVDNYSLLQPLINQKEVKENNDTVTVSLSFDSLQTTSNTILISDLSLTSGIYTGENIASSLLLSSDIKGHIHNPGYYFEDKSQERLQHLDLLMMTHGWRRYEWEPLLSGKQIALKYPVETALSLRGKVTKSDRNTFITDGRVNFIIKGDDSTHILSEATITDKGEFIVDNLRFNKKATVFYQGTNNRKENYIVDVKFYPAYIDTLNKAIVSSNTDLDTVNINSSAAMADFLRKQFNRIDTISIEYKNLAEIVVKGKKKIAKTDSLNLIYASPGVFQSGISLDPSAQNASQNIWLYLRSQVPGLVVEGGFINPTVSFNRYTASQLPLQTAEDETGNIAGGDLVNGMMINSGGIAFFLNETNVPQEVIETLVLDDIALVKVLRTEAATLGLPGGAIAIYTKKGVNLYRKIYEKNFSNIEIRGFTPVKQYYQQAIEPNKNLLQSATILWNAAFSNKQKTVTLNFLKSNMPRFIKVTIQGTDREGNLTLIEKVIEPSKK
jgi:hypothetical protein